MSDDIHPAVQRQLDELQAEIDRQRAELAAAREEREAAAARREGRAPAPRPKRSLTRPAPKVNPYDVYDEANPDDSFAKRWAESGVPRDTIEEFDRGDLEAVARRVGVELEWIPSVVVEALHHVRRDPGGWRSGPKADYLDVAGLERVVRRAVKTLEAADAEPAKAQPRVMGGYDYTGILPRRRSPSDSLMQTLFGDDDGTRRHAQELAHSLAAADAAREAEKKEREAAVPLDSNQLMDRLLGG